jgi:hypothetical protein
MLFLCPFARAAWFAEPWCIRSDTLVSNTHSIIEIIQSLMTMNHPNATMKNMFTFLWCLWKSSNNCLFNKNDGSPLHINPAAQAIIQAQALADVVLTPDNSVADQNNHHQQNPRALPQQALPQQGHTIRSNLLIACIKIFTGASWKNIRVPGATGQERMGIGVFLQFSNGGQEYTLLIQASTPMANSPLQAEAKALLFASIIAGSHQLRRPTFLTDSLILAKAATVQQQSLRNLNWDIRGIMADFFLQSTDMEPTIFHIPRDLNIIAHNCARQVIRKPLQQPAFKCVNKQHGDHSCPVVSVLENFHFQGYVIQSVLCT